MDGGPTEIITIGHSTHEPGGFLRILGRHHVGVLLDVRRYPGSRRVPWTNYDEIERLMAERQIGYEHLPGLGGRRRPDEDSPNGGWRSAQFRGYADHLGSPEFAAGLAALETEARKRRAAVMCAEALWWRCHRRLLADVLVVRGWRVLHVDSRGSTEHSLTEFANVKGDRVLYPPTADEG